MIQILGLMIVLTTPAVIGAWIGWQARGMYEEPHTDKELI